MATVVSSTARRSSYQGDPLCRPPAWTSSGPDVEQSDRILTTGALEFLADLVRAFGPQREVLLEQRRERQARLDAGELPDFLPETAGLRASEWTVATIPADLLDRRVEITGPTDRKMVINALNSGANVFMADFEDSNAPTWENLLRGQANLIDAVAGTIAYTAPDSGKTYRLGPRVATLMVRPRGWHLLEKHVRVDGKAGSGEPLRLRPVLLPQRAEPARPGNRAVLLPAQAREPPGSEALERRLRPRAGRARNSAGDRSAPRCSSRPSSRRSRWTRSSGSSGTTRPASTAGGGTTSSASSRSSGRGPTSFCPTAGA